MVSVEIGERADTKLLDSECSDKDFEGSVDESFITHVPRCIESRSVVELLI